MRAAWFERYGPARDVLRVGEMLEPEPAADEVRVRLRASGINPSDVKRRAGIRDREAYPRIIPHSDGAGVVDLDVVGVGGADPLAGLEVAHARLTRPWPPRRARRRRSPRPRKR